MKLITLFFFLALSAQTQASTLSQDFSPKELEKMGGEYMVNLFLFLDDVYCDAEEVRFPIERDYCIQAYLKELLLIKKKTWGDYFHKEAQGVYSKLNIMDEDSPQACDVTLEIKSLDKYYFNIYCDY